MSVRSVLSIIVSLSLILSFPTQAQYQELTGGTDLPTPEGKFTSVEDYNNQYFTNFKNSEEIEKDMSSQMKNYFKNLRGCVKGNYDFANYDFAEGPYQYDKTTIRGYEIGECTSETREVSKEVIDEHKTLTNCNHTPGKLKNYTDKYAEALVTDGPTDKAQNKINEGEINQCQTYINGVPVDIERMNPAEVITEIPQKHYLGVEAPGDSD